MWKASVCGVVCATWANRRDGVDGRYGQHLVLGGLVIAQIRRQYPDADCSSENVSDSDSYRGVGDDGDGGWARESGGGGGGGSVQKNDGDGSVEAWIP